jgi:hypothetical protein
MMSGKTMLQELRFIRDRIERIARVVRHNPKWAERLSALHLHYRVDQHGNYAGVEITVSSHVRVTPNGDIIGIWWGRQKALSLCEMTRNDIHDWGEMMFDSLQERESK